MSMKLLLNTWFVLLLYNCNSKLTTLADGHTKVSNCSKTYKNISKFNTELLQYVDTNALYKEVCFVQDVDSSKFGMNKRKKYRITYLPSGTLRNFVRFYSSGYVNWFGNYDTAALSVKNFNSDSTGFRGIYYRKKNGIICIELFQPVTGYGSYGINKQFVTFSADTMFVKDERVSVSSTVYIKQKMDSNLAEKKHWIR
jgi:hypothetical protein